jgi:hypothetical protein
VEFQAEARLLVSAWATIKAGQPEPSSHLETTCEIHHIYEDLNVLIRQTREKSAAGDSAEPKQ